MGNIRIVVDLAASKVSVEAGQGDLSDFLVKLRELLPSIKDIQINRDSGQTARQAPESSADKGSLTGEDVRTFARRLAPKGFRAQAGVLAFHAIKKQQQDHFTVEQMEDWFSLCGFKKPTSMSDNLTDASRKNAYIKHLGGGNWTLAPGGENLVIELEEGVLAQK